MPESKFISEWLVLGPIFNSDDQADQHFVGDGHPPAAEIIKDIDDNPLNPAALTALSSPESAPMEGTVSLYGNGQIFNPTHYTWRRLSFQDVDWNNLKTAEDDIHFALRKADETPDPANPSCFAGKHHALVLMVVYIWSAKQRQTQLRVCSDDSIRLWLNGVELGEPLRYIGERDIQAGRAESSADITLVSGWNILLAAVAETHVEWGFAAQLANADGLQFSAIKPSLKTNSIQDKVLYVNSPGSGVMAAKLAKLSPEATARIARKVPNLALLDHSATSQLVSRGTLSDADAGKLAIAKLALHVTGGDEESAGKVMDNLALRGVNKPQDLTKVSSDELRTVLETTGEYSQEVAAERANIIRSTVANSFPGTILAPSRLPLPEIRVRTGDQTVTVKSDVIKQAWQNNAGTDLMHLDISKDSAGRKSLNLDGLGVSERKAFIRDIQLRKGALIAAGDADTAEKLLKSCITSPSSMSPAGLANEAGISTGRAIAIKNRDILRNGRLSQGLFALIDAYGGGLQNLAVGNIRREKILEIVQPRAETGKIFDGLDNIQELFGNLDSCECKHYNSILGPAAYFVDLMHFIQTHVLDDKPEGIKSGSVDGPFKGKPDHILHLKTRRPDFWVLPLTQDNTETEISQLQITNEIFENFLAKKHGVSIASDRKAVVDEVYGKILPAGRCSVIQPFLLPIKEIEIYLAHFNLKRCDVAQLLEETEDVQLRTTLGLSKVQAELITTPDPSPSNIENKLGSSSLKTECCR